MKLLADENIDGPVVEHLRKAGHDVLYIAEAMPGAPDESVVGCANLQGHLLITADKDFGNILIRQRKISHGLLLLRLAGCSNSQKAAMVTGVIERHEGE